MAYTETEIKCIIAIAVGVMVDLFSVFLVAKRILTGRGASGIPLVSLVIYVVATVLAPGPFVLRGQPSLLFVILEVLVLASFHALCHIVVPMALLWWVNPGDRRAGKGMGGTGSSTTG
jgi:hypothetical protein